jgi:toxin-antitoxin system PIN domain toxin
LLLVDTNVLIYAHRADAPEHAAWRSWLELRVNGAEPWAVSVGAIAGFLRIVTNHRVFPLPTPLRDALAFVGALRSSPTLVVVGPGPRTLSIFLELVASTEAKGKHIPDAEIAAVALDHGCELASADRDFSRYPSLRWRHPLRG